MSRFNLLCMFITAALITSAAIAQAPIQASTANAIAIDRVGDSPVKPLDQPDGSVVVVVFGSVDCPVANAEVPEIRRIHERVKPVGASMVFVRPGGPPAPIVIRFERVPAPSVPIDWYTGPSTDDGGNDQG